MSVVIYNKKYIETLSEMLERFRIQYPQYKESKLTYAGRLDPLAEGVMIILTDEDVHKKDLAEEKVKQAYLLGYHVNTQKPLLNLSGNTYSFQR